jgi:hypothetical protein
MRGVRGRHVFRALVAEFQGVDAAEQVLSGAEEDRRDCEVHLVDQAFPQVVPDRCNASADSPDIATMMAAIAPARRIAAITIQGITLRRRRLPGMATRWAWGRGGRSRGAVGIISPRS